MPASRAGLFDSLRQLSATALELAQLRLELLVADLELEKLRLIEAALFALLGLTLLGLGLVLLCAFVLLLVGEAYRLQALGVLLLLCLGAGLMLLQSRTRAPSCAPPNTPSSHRTTASTSGVSLTQITMISLLAATSAGDVPAAAPCSTSAALRLAVRFQTRKGKPALSKLAAMPRPIMPRPTNPTRSPMGLLLLLHSY